MVKKNSIKALFGVMLTMILFSCSIAKKNEKAYQRVITDSTTFRKVGLLFRSIYQKPCVSDTIIIDSTQILILSDTVQLIGNTDTLNRVDTIRITHTKINTVTKYIVDNRAIHELQDSIHDLRLRLATQTGQIGILSSDRDKAQESARIAQKQAKNAGWLMWSVIALAVITHGLRSIPSIRKAIGI